MMINQVSSQEKERIGDYYVLRDLSNGSFGRVVCAVSSVNEERLDQEVCSQRKLTKIRYCSETADGHRVWVTALDRFRRECQILSSLKHINIVKYIEDFTVEDEGLVAVVTELSVHGCILRYDSATARYAYSPAALHCCHWISAEMVIRYYTDAIQAVSYLHARSICHRDIKPDNLLLSSNGARLLLCDFGCAEYFNPMENPGGCVLDTVGTPANWAPEVVFPEKYSVNLGLDISESITGINRNSYSAYGADMWSLGVLLFVMLYLKHPFYEEELSEPALFALIDSVDPLSDEAGCGGARVCAADYGAEVLSVIGVTVEHRAALEGLLQKEPNQRWCIDTLRAHLLGDSSR